MVGFPLIKHYIIYAWQYEITNTFVADDCHFSPISAKKNFQRKQKSLTVTSLVTTGTFKFAGEIGQYF